MKFTTSNGHEVMLDERDAHLANALTWRFNLNKNGIGYVRAVTRASGAKRTVYLHRLILEPPPGVVVDHINGNTLDNRRANLRTASYSQNAQNSRAKSCSGRVKPSRYKGLTFRYGKWIAKIRHSGRQHEIGRFCSEVAAAMAYDAEAAKHHGKFASTNFPHANARYCAPQPTALIQPDPPCAETASSNV